MLISPANRAFRNDLINNLSSYKFNSCLITTKCKYNFCQLKQLSLQTHLICYARVKSVLLYIFIHLIILYYKSSSFNVKQYWNLPAHRTQTNFISYKHSWTVKDKQSTWKHWMSLYVSFGWCYITNILDTPYGRKVAFCLLIFCGYRSWS